MTRALLRFEEKDKTSELVKDADMRHKPRVEEIIGDEEAGLELSGNGKGRRSRGMTSANHAQSIHLFAALHVCRNIKLLQTSLCLVGPRYNA